MQEGAQAQGAFTVSAGRVTPEKMAANEQAISALDDYLVTAGNRAALWGLSRTGSGRRARTTNGSRRRSHIWWSQTRLRVGRRATLASRLFKMPASRIPPPLRTG